MPRPSTPRNCPVSFGSPDNNSNCTYTAILRHHSFHSSFLRRSHRHPHRGAPPPSPPFILAGPLAYHHASTILDNLQHGSLPPPEASPGPAYLHCYPTVGGSRCRASDQNLPYHPRQAGG